MRIRILSVLIVTSVIIFSHTCYSQVLMIVRPSGVFENIPDPPKPRIDDVDIPGLTEALRIARSNAARDYWISRLLVTGGMCVGAAFGVSTDLGIAATDPNSPLSGWGIRTIHSTVHVATLLTSPFTGMHYYIDNNLDPNVDLVKMDEFPPGKWRPVSGQGLHVLDLPGLNEWQEYQGGVDVPPMEQCIPPESTSSLSTSPIASFDPNDKVGSQGIGGLQYLSSKEPLRYSIFFESLETATAPAQEVIITDQLDTAKMDLNTLRLGPITFGNTMITPPSGVSTFATEVSVPGQILENLTVRIEGSLNPNTGVLSWRFISTNPATGDLPENPREGFLPPNVNPPEGDGNVLFTVMPKTDLPTGTEIRNHAEIVFDVNSPIVTPEWLNTIDNDKPESIVLPLTSIQNLTDFLVEWTGNDIGVGIKDYTIYVSEDDGPYTQWLSNTPNTSGVFSGQYGKKYSFYSIARDQTGNIEVHEAIAETTTQITLVPGDLNHDGNIDINDYNLFRSALGKCLGDDGYTAEADYDEDSCISYADYRIWYGYYRAAL